MVFQVKMWKFEVSSSHRFRVRHIRDCLRDENKPQKQVKKLFGIEHISIHQE